MLQKAIYGFVISFFILMNARGQAIAELVEKARIKIEKVKDYEAEGKMKTNVIFLKVPVAKVKLYFKNPDKFRLTSEKGVSFLPKGSVNINLGSIFRGNGYTVIDAGSDNVKNQKVRVAKLLPDDENSDLVLTTLYIEPVSGLILKSRTTTKENGTYELSMTYNRYSNFGLPDELLFSFNIKDYKLPKGITFDFDDGTTNGKKAVEPKNKKGEVLLTLTKYEINKGLPDTIFK